MNPVALLHKYFSASPAAIDIVLEHSRMVAEKALHIATRLPTAVDLVFVEEAALLHDIGVCRTSAPFIGCTGPLPYLCHGIAGREILESEDLPLHAMVCERHIGVGLTREDIQHQNLPLPLRDMVPVSLEERIVAFADLFFSKTPGKLTREKSPEQVRAGLASFGADKAAIFDRMQAEFNIR
jgi:uncharacterized protein